MSTMCMNHPIITNTTPATTTTIISLPRRGPIILAVRPLTPRPSVPPCKPPSCCHYHRELRCCLGAFTGSLPALKVKVRVGKRRWEKGECSLRGERKKIGFQFIIGYKKGTIKHFLPILLLFPNDKPVPPYPFGH